MKQLVACPCGTVIRAADEDTLVTETQEHLIVQHGRSYSREEILVMAM